MMKFPYLRPHSKSHNYLELDFGQFQILGRGLAGIESVYSIPQWDLTLDIGRAPDFMISNSTLALTHWHLDHSGGLPYLLGLRCLNNTMPLRVVVPDAKVEMTQRYLQMIQEITESQLSFTVHPASQDLELKRNLTLRSVASSHCISSTGYAVLETRQHLKSEFANKSSDELRDLKSKGVEIQASSQIMQLAYSGDSRADFFKTNAVEAQVFIMECSFFGEDDDRSKIDHYGHTHIDDWVKYQDRIQAPVVVMTHTSQRYSREDVLKFCQKRLSADLLSRLIVFR